MEPGFVIDEGYGTRTVAHWVGGEPVRSIWTGLKLKGKDKRPIVTYRCRRCGYLEGYS